MNERASQELAMPPEELLRNYSVSASAFDELQAAPLRLRPLWRPLLDSFQTLGGAELATRWESARRILREHGVTYNAYGEPDGMDLPWDLDLVPLLVGAEEWARLEAGLVQRARLLNLVLADVYGGAQHLVRDGFLPAELLYANPGFLRACRGIPVTAHVYLHLLACDLGRSPDGQWWVLADCSQAPTGAGFAWENRTVISRVLPGEIRALNVQRLGNFFRQQRDLLFNLAPQGRAQPNAVLLSPGPQHEAYFEHAYLARHLGFALVEGADLAVRDRRVFLRTIEGLQPVDVVVRRVDDSASDPLELQGDSFLGVSGLLEACRAGNVTVANAVGAGLVESPVFLAFLPSLCRHLLGEELLLPSVATWWCGQAEEHRYVIEHLDQLLVKPAFGPASPLPLSGQPQTPVERAKLGQMLQARPECFVAQESINLSQAPVWTEAGLTARSMVLRAFVANGGDSFAVLPGGLARVWNNPGELAASMHGGGSKDAWVLSNGAEFHTELVSPRPEPRLASPLPAGVPSRAADHLFWLGRYTERLAQLLRVLRCVLGRFSGENGQDSPAERNDLAQLVVRLKLWPAQPNGAGDTTELPDRMLRLLYEPEAAGGVPELLERVRSSAAAVRDRFSGDMWRILGRLDADGRARPGPLPVSGATELLHQLVLDLAAFDGMEMENMTRGLGWRFLDLGRRLERALAIVRQLAAAAAVRAGAAAVLDPLLEIADSAMTYRRRYFSTPAWSGVLELLLRDESNPRSLAFQVEALREHARMIALGLKTGGPPAEPEPLGALTEALHSVNVNELALQLAQDLRQPLLDLLAGWATQLAALSDQVTRRYFSLTSPHVT